MGTSGITTLSGSIFDYCTLSGLNSAFTKGGAYAYMRTALETIQGVCGPLYNNFPTRVKNTLYVTPGYNALALLLRQNNGQTFIRRTMEQKHSWGFSTIKQGALANNFTYLKMLDDMFIYLPSDLYATIMNDLYGRNGQYQEQLKLQSHNMYGSNRLGVQNSDKLLKRVVYNGVYSSTTGNVTASYTFTNTTTKVKKRKVYLFHGQKRYEPTDHLGNVVTTISERRVCDSTGTFSAEVITQTGYEPFGAGQAGRQYHASKDSGYRFGFNTQLKTDEILGPGNSYSAEFWQYDARIGRRWNLDPVPQISISDFACFGNNPIEFTEPLGNEKNPVFNKNGDLLGTDEEGIAGMPFIMDVSDFKQGMSHAEALAKNKGYNALGDGGGKITESYSKVYNFMATIPNRPDFDGKITLDEATDNYRRCEGRDLFVDLDQIDLINTVYENVFTGSEPKSFNLIATSNDGLVYGQLTFTLNSNHTVRAGSDRYDFEMHNPWYNHIPRNIKAKIGELYAGEGIGYMIHINGKSRPINERRTYQLPTPIQGQHH